MHLSISDGTPKLPCLDFGVMSFAIWTKVRFAPIVSIKLLVKVLNELNRPFGLEFS